MTNQQKIKFWLDRGFRVLCVYPDGCESVYCFESDSGDFIGYNKKEKYIIRWSQRSLEPISVSPLTHQQCDYKVGDKVVVLEGTHKDSTGKIDCSNDLGCYWVMIDKELYNLPSIYLAPSLPEDEEAEEIEAEISNIEITGSSFTEGGIKGVFKEFVFVKADGKKLKIKVVNSYTEDKWNTA